jgi:hypothetical protein
MYKPAVPEEGSENVLALASLSIDPIGTEAHPDNNRRRSANRVASHLKFTGIDRI